MDKNSSGSGASRSAQEILRFAVRREEKAAHLYGELAERSTALDAKALFHELQAEEVKHTALLEEIASGQSEVMVLHPVPDLKISDYLVDEPISAESHFQEILIFAAKKEAHALALYSVLQDHAVNPEHRRLFEFLAQEEKRHKLRLEQEYERHVLEED